MGNNKWDTESFIERSKELNGDFYDYSKTQYVGYSSKITLICPKHGQFQQRAADHLKGKGCRVCGWEVVGQKRRLGLGKFIERATSKHGEQFDYSLVNYTTNSEDIIVICKDHGEFVTTPAKVLAAAACPSCIEEKVKKGSGIKPVQHFLDKSFEVHGDRYDYSKVDYKGTQHTVEIVCEKHGRFDQKASDHMLGYGCAKCGIEKCSELRTYKLEEFIEKAVNMHGEFYDYSEVDYKNSKSKVKIICKEHGEFWQSAQKHMSGQGCRQCSVDINSKKYCKTTEHFVNNAKKIYGDKYDYSQVDYTTLRHPVIIICNDHGEEFKQTPASHLHSREGCSICLADKMNGFVSKIYQGDDESNLYIITLGSENPREKFFKVGLSVRPESRWAQIGKETGYDVKEVSVFSGSAKDLFKCEQLTLATHKNFKHEPGISFAGKTECLNIEHLSEVLSFIRSTLDKKKNSFKEKNYEGF